MRKLFQSLAIAASLFTFVSPANAQVSFGIRIGPPPAPRAYHVPRQPGPDYTWVEGYWFPEGSRYKWHDGYWTRPPYEGAYWVDPYYVGGQYFAGRWEGSHGNILHDHRWDRSKQRDDHRDDHHDSRDRNDGHR